MSRRSTIVLAGVTRRFGDVTALDRLDLAVSEGEVVGLLGHNGAGKTTTVRVLAGLLTPQEGAVEVRGLDPTHDGPAVRRSLGVLPSRPVVDDRLTARANLRFVADVWGLAADTDDVIATSLEAVGLSERADDRVAGFSTGMRQRLSLARVLLPRPPILLLDEPTASLDPVAARDVRRLLADLARDAGRTIVVCTHDLAEAEQLCDRVVVLERGRVVAEGSPAALAAEHGHGGLMLQVAHDDVPLALTIVDAIGDGSAEVEAAGRIRSTGVPRDAVPGLLRELTARGCEVFEARRLDPTLEDVYLALHAGGEDIAEVPESGSGSARAASRGTRGTA